MTGLTSGLKYKPQRTIPDAYNPTLFKRIIRKKDNAASGIFFHDKATSSFSFIYSGIVPIYINNSN